MELGLWTCAFQFGKELSLNPSVRIIKSGCLKVKASANVTLKLQGVQIDVASGMGLLQECFWTLRGPQRLLWDPKDGRKLLLGMKHTIVD